MQGEARGFAIKRENATGPRGGRGAGREGWRALVFIITTLSPRCGAARSVWLRVGPHGLVLVLVLPLSAPHFCALFVFSPRRVRLHARRFLRERVQEGEGGEGLLLLQ